MKNKSFKNILIFIVLLLFFISLVFFGTGIIMIFVEYSTKYLLFGIVGAVVTVLNMYWIYLLSNNYKLKYFFLGNDFKVKVNQYFSNFADNSKIDKKSLLKTMKHQYRQNGNFFVVDTSCKNIPFDLWSQMNNEFNYANALEKQKSDYIVYCLFLNCEDGGGLYRFFESLSMEMFSYEEYCNIITKQKLFSKSIKELLLNHKYKSIIELFKLDKLNAQQMLILQNFELTDSNLIFQFSKHLTNVVQKLSIDFYLEQKIFEGLPKNIECLYLSKNKMVRFCILFDDNLNVYKVLKSKFIFNCKVGLLMHSEGYWNFENEGSLYATLELAFEAIKEQVKDYLKIK